MRALKSHNITNDVIVAEDGVQAVEYLFGAKGRPGAEELPAGVLPDLKPPRLDGLQGLERLRADQRTRELPVRSLTSSDEERAPRKGYRPGAQQYARKPAD